jgi:hypothetical protein
MNEQQLAAVKQALEALECIPTSGSMLGTYAEQKRIEAITALQSIISQDALDKKAENARELGLSYDDAVKGGVGIMLGGKRIDPASIYAEPKIGCVNHDCDKCKAVQEPWGYLEIDDIESQREYPHNCRNVNLWHEGGEGMTAIYIAPPAPQPVPVKTYHDGKPWPVAPKPWVGLADEEVVQCQQGDVYHFYRCIEAKLKEKNA